MRYQIPLTCFRTKIGGLPFSCPKYMSVSETLWQEMAGKFGMRVENTLTLHRNQMNNNKKKIKQ